MGILNVTPDSFSDGGQFDQLDQAMSQVREMIAAGADIIDIGGESTRPGADPVSVDEELARVLPVIEAIRAESDVPISIDTVKSEVMYQAVAAGASMINDVNALQDSGAVACAAQAGVPVCLMHRKGDSKTMQNQSQYTNVVEEVAAFLAERAAVCVKAGISPEQIVIDPGFGFGKTVEHNLQLFQQLPKLGKQHKVLVGVSRKSMLGSVLDRPVDQRLSASIALAGLATWLNAAIIRVHDVTETVDAVRITRAVRDVAPA